MNFTKNGLFGFVIGDALGVPVEFMSRENLDRNKVTDMIGFGSHSQPEGTWSDDTSMTIATMDSISKNNCIDYDDIMKNFASWYQKAEYTATDKLFDIGISTRNAINKYVYGIPATSCGGIEIYTNGNGSLMRMLPFALYLFKSNLSREEEVRIIKNASSLTHAHEISVLGCLIYVDYLKLLMQGYDKEKAYDELKNIKYDDYFEFMTIAKYSRILNDDLKNFHRDDIKSTGYVIDTLEASIWCTLKSNNYEEAILKAVNLGDDTDTVGAITGSINGILYGYESIPKKWIDILKKKDYIESLCESYTNALTNIGMKNKI